MSFKIEKNSFILVILGFIGNLTFFICEIPTYSFSPPIYGFSIFSFLFISFLMLYVYVEFFQINYSQTTILELVKYLFIRISCGFFIGDVTLIFFGFGYISDDSLLIMIIDLLLNIVSYSFVFTSFIITLNLVSQFKEPAAKYYDQVYDVS